MMHHVLTHPLFVGLILLMWATTAYVLWEQRYRNR
jgi:hypothetical protein